MKIKIVSAEYGAAGKLAEAELEFTDGALAGLRLIGFGIWERRTPSGARSVTFPARQYSVNGERRSFALLRPSTGLDAAAAAQSQDAIKDAILAEFARLEAIEREHRAVAVPY